MQKKYQVNLIVSRRSYTSEELASVLKVHIQTVRDWRRKGLKTLDNNAYPYLFLGSDIRQFLQQKINSYKVKLKGGEFYCLKCRKGVSPRSIKHVDRNILIGKGRHSIFLEGTCPICGMRLKRFSTKERESELNSKSDISKKLPMDQQQFNIFK